MAPKSTNDGRRRRDGLWNSLEIDGASPKNHPRLLKVRLAPTAIQVSVAIGRQLLACEDLLRLMDRFTRNRSHLLLIRLAPTAMRLSIDSHNLHRQTPTGWPVEFFGN